MAAQTGHAGALVNLSATYLNERGVEKDLEKGLEYQRPAAEEVHLIAMFNLAYASS